MQAYGLPFGIHRLMTSWVSIKEALLFIKERTSKKVAAYEIQHPTPSPQKTAEIIFWPESPIYLSSVFSCWEKI